jgi:hypothetical protein
MLKTAFDSTTGIHVWPHMWVVSVLDPAAGTLSFVTEPNVSMLLSIGTETITKFLPLQEMQLLSFIHSMDIAK